MTDEQLRIISSHAFTEGYMIGLHASLPEGVPRAELKSKFAFWWKGFLSRIKGESEVKDE